jgi:cytoskeletal protein CcmA (bactofilin family)
MEPSKATLIDAHADVDGKLKGKDAQILGRFRGEIEVTGRLVLGEGSRVDAKVVTDAAEVAGEFKGDITAKSVTLTEKARVEGTLEAQVLVVREGAHLNASVNAGAAGKPKATPPPAVGALTG